MKKTVKNNVYWVGKSDWELRQFHGYEYSTNKGSTYNSYLICEKKNVLIDTVFKPFSREFIENLSANDGLHYLAERFKDDVLEVETQSPGILKDFDTKQDYLNEINK